MNIFWSNTISSALQIFLAFGGTTSIVALIIYAFKGVIAAWISRQFLEQNTVIVERAKREFTHALEDHRAELTISLDKYRLELNRSLEEYKSKLSGDLASQVEPLKAALSRDNIGFQITHTEYIKRQFLRVEELFSHLLDLQRFVLGNYKMEIDINEGEVYKKQTAIYEKMGEVSNKALVAAFFLPELIGLEISTYMDKVNTLVEIYEGYWHVAKALRDSSLDSQEHQNAVELSQIERNNYLEQRKQIGVQFALINKALRALMSTSSQ